MTEPILSVKNLQLGYGKQVILRKISFDVKDGDFIAVVGANGSGKSTLIHALLGLIKPLSGDIHFGCHLNHTHIGYLPQEMRHVTNFPATVEEIVLSGTLGRLKMRPFYGPAEHRAVKGCLKALGISKLLKASFADLSGGQKQKVLLARALAASSELLILDEPSNNLDYESREDFYQTLKQLNGQKPGSRAHHGSSSTGAADNAEANGLTIIMITHDLDAQDLIGNKVLAIKNGTAELYDTADYLRRFK